MRVALQVEFKVEKREPLGALMARAHSAFAAAGLSPPMLRFTLADSAMGGAVSAVDRALKRHADLAPFLITGASVPGLVATRRLSNEPGTPAAGRTPDIATLVAVANGVPRSLPFHQVAIVFRAPEFGALPEGLRLPIAEPGLAIHDNWWVSGRARSMTVTAIVEGDAKRKALPPLPPAVAALITALGPTKKPRQIALPTITPAATSAEAAAPASENAAAARAVAEVVQAYRAKLADTIARAGLPHDLPPPAEARAAIPLGTVSGPRKPALDAAFKPLGYSCKGGSGVFTLRRRTASNHTVEISLDVGSWSNSLTAFFRVLGLGWRAPHPLPATRHETGPLTQHPIGDAARWQQLVENLAAMVAELERGFVREIEAVAGPSPEWFDPPP